MMQTWKRSKTLSKVNPGLKTARWAETRLMGKGQD